MRVLILLLSIAIFSYAREYPSGPSSLLTVSFSKKIVSDYTGAAMTGAYGLVKLKLRQRKYYEGGGTSAEYTVYRIGYAYVNSQGYFSTSVQYRTWEGPYETEYGEEYYTKNQNNGWATPTLEFCSPLVWTGSYYISHPTSSWNYNSIVLTESGINKYLENLYGTGYLPSEKEWTYTENGNTYTGNISFVFDGVDFIAGGDIKLKFTISGSLYVPYYTTYFKVNFNADFQIATTISTISSNGITRIGISLNEIVPGNFTITSSNYSFLNSGVKDRLEDIFAEAVTIAPDHVYELFTPLYGRGTDGVYVETTLRTNTSTPIIVTGGTSNDKLTILLQTRYATGVAGIGGLL